MNINVTELSELELFDLKNRIVNEFKDRKNREKILIYKVFVPFLVNEGFIKKENAIKRLQQFITEYEYVDDFKKEDDYIQLGISFIDKSGLQSCEDFKK